MCIALFLHVYKLLNTKYTSLCCVAEEIVSNEKKKEWVGIIVVCFDL